MMTGPLPEMHSPAALHEAEARFRTAFENAPIGMALLSPDGRFLQVNGALCTVLGRSEEQLLASSWRDVTHPDDRSDQEAQDQEVLAGRRHSSVIEQRYVRPDGTEAWVMASRSLVRDAEGRPMYFISQLLDISDRKKVEEILRIREEETRRILETAQDAFIGMDAHGRITDWNRQAEDIFGWPRDEAIGRTLAETIIPERYREQHWRGLNRYLETGHGPVLGKRLELSAVRRDGTEFPVELTIWPLESKKGHRFNALVHDISERVHSQEELARQKQELTALHETTLDLIRRLEPTSLLEAILARAAALMRTEHAYLYVVDPGTDELIARVGTGRFSDLPGRRLKRGQGLVGLAWQTGRPVAVEDYHSWPGRLPEFDWMRATVALPLTAGSDIVGVLGLVHAEEGVVFDEEQVDLLTRFGRLASLALDNARLYHAAQQELQERRRAEKELERSATELRQANEELLAADEMKSHFVAVASHELRTPLTSVLGFATTLLNHWERIPDQEKREQIGLIEGQARRLARLADDLLIMSKIEAGALEVRTEPVDVGEAAEGVVSAFADADLEVRVDPGLRAMADRDHLEQILMNYVSNALKYGQSPVRIDARRRHRWVEMVVADGGDGVPEEFVPRLFEKFAQAGRIRSGSGTGLGLSIVRGLARAQGGEAWYEPGEPGSRFCVRLPAS
jgi:PAS domain S-box-containing protein